MELATAGDADRPWIASLLEKSGLPTDLDGAELYVALVDGERVDCGGFEIDGTDALLRSIAVDPAARGEGYGREITERLCATAAERGVKRLSLLTTTAADFFEKRGFERVERGRVPDSIANTKQFTQLCPESATCMHRTL
ncbi:MAG: arsenic resistance N-acetyltransferase ArsN2 [Halalkalicoccus sp.]